MNKYLKLNFHQRKEKLENDIIDNKHWNNTDDWDTEIKNISEDIKTKRENSRLYKLINKNNGDKLNLTSEFTKEEIEKVIIKLKKNKSVGSDDIAAETLIHNYKWISNVLVHIFNTMEFTRNTKKKGYGELPPLF